MTIDFQAILDSAPCGVLVFEHSGTVVYANKASRSMLCIPHNKIPLDISTFDRTFAGASGIINLAFIDQGSLQKYTTELRTFDGRAFIAEAAVHKSGKYYIASYQDSTYKQAFLESTTAFGLRNEIALDSIPDPIYVLDKQGRWLHANKAAINRLGLAEDEIVDRTSKELRSQRPWLDNFFMNEEKMAREAWLSGAQQLTVARAGNSRNAKKEIYQQFFVPNFDKAGEPWLMLVYSRNITAIAEAQELSDERAEMLSSILSNNSVGIALYENEVLKYGNSTFLGYVNNAAEYFCHLDRTPASFFRRLNDFLRENKLEKVPASVWDYYSRDGQHRLLELEFTRRTSQSDEKVSTTIMLHDVTEMMRMEAEQRSYSIRLHHLAAKIEKVQEEERQSLSSEVHDIVGGVAAALHMRMGLLIMQLDGVAPDDAFANLQECESLSGTLVSNIRRIVKGLEDILPADADPKEVIVLYAGRFCGMFGITPFFEFRTQDWKVDTPTLFTLVKILREAINNAGKHSGCSQITIRGGAAEQGNFIEISDDGSGMPASRREDGNGIKSMKRQAESLNGDLKINSTQWGTTLYCYIPTGALTDD